jgi:hypothetical protein
MTVYEKKFIENIEGDCGNDMHIRKKNSSCGVISLGLLPVSVTVLVFK